MTKNTVLILLDGSEFRERILPHVRRFIRPEENELILFRVGNPPLAHYIGDEGFYIDLYHVDKDQTQATITTQLREELLDTKTLLEEAGYSVSREVRLGNVAREIENYIVAYDIDLVAMTTRGRTGIHKALYGSIAEHVLRNATIPVMLLYAPD